MPPAAGKSFLAVACPPHSTVGVTTPRNPARLRTRYRSSHGCCWMSDVLFLGSVITDREAFTCVPISGVDETVQSIITNPLFQIMTELSPTMLIASTVYTDCMQWDTRGGPLECLRNCSRQTAHQSNEEPSRRGITHRPDSKIPPKGRAGGDSISRMQACTTLCMVRPLRSHLTCRTQKCAGVACWWRSSSLSEGLAAGSQIQFNPAHFHQCAVLPRVVLWCGVVCCIAVQCSSSKQRAAEAAAAAEAEAEAEAAGAANGCLA